MQSDGGEHSNEKYRLESGARTWKVETAGRVNEVGQESRHPYQAEQAR